MTQLRYDTTDLEKQLLGCYLLRPELLSNSKLKPEDFTHYRRFVEVFKDVYHKYHSLDVTVVCTLMPLSAPFLADCMDEVVAPSVCSTLEQELLDLNNQRDKDKYIREEAFKLTSKLCTFNLSTKDYLIKIQELYCNADSIYKEVD